MKSSTEVSDELKQKGNEAFSKGEYKKAAKIYRDAIKLNPNNLVLYSNRAICLLNLKDYERALKDCNNGLDIVTNTPAKVKLQFRRALSLKGLSRIDEAKLLLLEAKKLDPANKAVILELEKFEEVAVPQMKSDTKSDDLVKIDIVRVKEISPEFRIS